MSHPPYIFIILVLLFIGCAPVTKEPPLSLIIDADTANEVDDLYALVRVIIEPSINLLGITSAQFHTSPLASDTTVLESQKINETLLQIMNVKDIPLPVGSNDPIINEDEPASSEASQFIIDKALQMPGEEILHLVILGSCTNVASAILQDPTIIPRINVHYLGFWHDQETNSYNKKEFNSGNDTLAVEILLNTRGLKLDIMSATTSQHLVFEKEKVDSLLKGQGGVADYLVDRWESYTRWWTDEDPLKERWIMWDLALIEALLKPEMATRAKFTTPKENTNRIITIYTEIDVPAMSKDFWDKMESYLNSRD